MAALVAHSSFAARGAQRRHSADALGERGRGGHLAPSDAARQHSASAPRGGVEAGDGLFVLLAVLNDARRLR